MLSPDDVLGPMAACLAAAEHPLFITGAGLSADSGLPTYRGVGGLYEGANTAEGMPVEVALGGTVFRQHPDISWKYLWQIGSAVRRATPNRGHQVLAAIERVKPDTWILTQNIDGFHRAAGSRNVIEIHGRMLDLHCVGCEFTSDAASFFGPLTDTPPVLPPRCTHCGSVLRPSVVMFEEPLPEDAIRQLSTVVFRRPRDLVVVIGTTAVFPYIELPVREARDRGIPIFEINPQPSAVSALVNGRLAERAAPALDRLWPRR